MRIGILLIAVFICFSSLIIPKKRAVLVFCKTMGYHHESIPNGIKAIQLLGKENGYEVDTTTNSETFNRSALSRYAALIFLNTTDTADKIFNTEQKDALVQYIKKGGGFVGIHAAADALYQWKWYGGLVGAYFKSHPKIQQAIVHIADVTQPLTKSLTDPWIRTDEWYNYKEISKEIHVLLTLDEHSYKGGENGDGHPIAWAHMYQGGRSFYTGLGHTAESYVDPQFLKHLEGGIEFAMGK